MKTKLISYLCVIALVVTMFPVSAFAATYGNWYCPNCATKNALEYEGDD